MARPLGMKHSEEARALMSEKRKARPPETPEQKEKRIAAIRASLANKPLPESQKEKIRQSVLNTIAQNGQKGVFKMTQGEQQIADLLDSKGISYIPQYRIPGKNHPYDFYVPKFKLLIEFDGAHHWKDSWWETDPKLKEAAMAKTIVKDWLNDHEAMMAGYSLVRIKGENKAGDSYHGTLHEQLNRTSFGFITSLPAKSQSPQLTFNGLLAAWYPDYKS
ncbi:hypothetical protein D3C72_1036620 [compost metagenome]